MFRSKRSGLVRRIWRSRLVTNSDGGDGSKRSEGGRDGSCGSNPEKIPKTEHRSVTRTDPSLGTFSEPWNENLTDGAGQDYSDHGRGAVCVPEHRGSRRGHESDSGTVTCCLFRERDLRPRVPDSAPRKERRAPCQCGPRNARLVANSRPVVEEELKNVTYALLKRLKEKPLDALLKAVESKGGMPSECVSVPQTELRLGGHTVSPQYLLCKLYRWSDLQHTAQLKALCHWQSFGAVDSAKVCCNPYHYSRLCGPESPPPPYSVSPSDEHKPLDLSDSPLSYTETVAPHFPNCPPVTPRDYRDTGTSLGSSTSGGRGSYWCSVAYWEQRTRVGRLYPAHEPSLSIFYDLPQGTGLCLGQLHANAYSAHRHDADNHGIQAPRSNHCHGSRGNGGGGMGSSVQRTRRKIGYGIVLSREPDGVWVYNRSQHPVFVHSPTLDLPGARGLTAERSLDLPGARGLTAERTLDLPGARGLTAERSLDLPGARGLTVERSLDLSGARGLAVKRVMPGFSLKVFDYERSSWVVEHRIKPEYQEGPWDPHSVRISFAKGWGPCYSRQFITSCPCWLEVLLNNHR